MGNLLNKRSLLLFAGLALIAIALLCESLFAPLVNTIYQKAKIQSALSTLHQKESEAEEMLERAKKENPYDHENWYMEKSKKDGIYFFIYSANNLRVSFWTTNSILPKVVPFQDTTIMQSLANGYYLEKNTYYKDLIFVTLVPIEYNYSLHNNYLQNNFALLSSGSENFHISLNKADEGVPFYSEKGLYLFNLHTIKNPADYYWIGWCFLIGLACYCMFINGWLVQLLSGKNILGGIALYFISIITPLVLWHFFHYPRSLFEWQLFSPELYASSNILSSLGSLLILSAFFCWTFRIFSHVRLASISRSTRKIFVGLQILFVFLLAHIINAVVRSLVSDSKISFDLGNISEISIYTLFAFAAITGFILAFFILLHAAINNAFRIFHSRRKIYAIIGFIAVAIALVSFFKIYHFSIAALFFSLGSLLFYTFRYYRTGNDRLIGFAVILSTMFITMVVTINDRAKEKEIQKVLASRLFSERDAIGEFMYGDVFDQIKDDNYLTDYFLFRNPLLSQNILKQRIMQLYLSGYFSKYDVELLSFSPAGNPYKGNYENQLEFYTGLVSTNKAVPARDDSSLYFLNSYNGLPAYLSFVPVERDGNFLGTLVLVFTQKAFYEESVYPELLLSENLKPLKRLQEYSYAIYVNNHLITQKGDYSYNEALKGNFQTKAMYSFIKADGFTHFIYHLSPEQTIIVSDKEEGFLYYSATFSIILFFFIASLVFVVIFRLLFIGIFAKNSLGIRSIVERARTAWRNLSFRAKVLLSIISSVTIALFLIGFTTIKYISYHYNQEELQKMVTKTRYIKERLETQLKNDFQQAPVPGEELTSFIKTLSKLYLTDINVYDIDGKLLGYSQPAIYDKKLIQQRMEPNAYFNFISLNHSRLLSEENIGKLNYIAAYMPLQNGNTIVGFVGLPYFAKERELDDAISSFLEALINLYLLLFLGLLIISLVISNALTAPLNIIRNHLRSTSLTTKNEQIHWENNDEIGKLVKEYNSMVLELSESYQRLAQSEREGAWREMAKQVAHEIKNPLTPMKLNIQQLQRAWKEDPQRLKEMFEKVTTLLITQIDRLSQIATEFSSFAQMPNEQPIKLDVNEALREAVDLFHNTNEVSISLFTPHEPLYTWMDAGHFARVLNNLVKNAIQAMIPGRLGMIVLSCKKDNDKIIIEVRDNGTGIPESLRDKIFTPNFSTKSSGMGLGLAIIKNIIERAGGTIRFETKLGEGTSFFIEIPEYTQENK